MNAPSLFNCDFRDLPAQLDELVGAGVDFFHIDLMDGHYVPNLAFPTKFVSELKKAYPNCTADVHLMVSEPERYIPILAEYGADYVSFHADSTRFARRLITEIQRHGMKAGVVINPSQPMDVVSPYISALDYVVLMTVEPGFAGQRFLSGSLERLEALNALRMETENQPLIEIDGGIDYSSAEACVRRGADILVTGVFVTFEQREGTAAAVRRFASTLAQVPRG